MTQTKKEKLLLAVKANLDELYDLEEDTGICLELEKCREKIETIIEMDKKFVEENQ